MPETQWCANSAHQRGQTVQGQSVSAVAGPGKCIWLITTQAGAAHTDKRPFPSRIRDFKADYFRNFSMRASSGNSDIKLDKIEIGIITGCTVSVILFSLAMNMLAKSAEPEYGGLKMKSVQCQPPIRAFMDDITVTTESVLGKFQFNVAGTTIPAITGKAVKSLGKVFCRSQRDAALIQSTCTVLDG